MIIDSSACGPVTTNVYLLTCPETKQACLVDAAADSLDWFEDKIAQRQAEPTLLLLTHSHWDHIAEAKKIRDRWKIPVAIHAEDLPNLEKPGSDRLPCWIPVPALQADRLVKDQEWIIIGNSRWQVIHTPGHSPGCICLYCPHENLLISGDTLFKGSIGNLSFPTSSPDRMWQSIEKLVILPAETRVFPGHGEPTTIGAETWLKDAKQLFG